MTALAATIVLARLGGVATLEELRAYTTRHALRVACERGEVVRTTRGRYGLAAMPDAHRIAAQVGGFVSHLSAAGHHGLPVLVPPTQPQVSVRRNAHPSAGTGARLYYRELAPGEVTGSTTTARRTVLDCADTLPFAEALAVADSALRLQVCTRPELVAAATAWSGRRRAAVLRVASCADGRPDNPFESALRALALDAGCEGFVPQVRVRVGRRSVRVDLADRRRRIVLEADSFEWHGNRTALRRDCRRYDELVRAGWVVLRFSWEHVMFDREWVMAVIRDVVAAHPPHEEELAGAARTRPAACALSSSSGGDLSGPARQKRTVAKVPTRRKPTRS